jgi:hypothetical protein
VQLAKMGNDCFGSLLVAMFCGYFEFLHFKTKIVHPFLASQVLSKISVVVHETKF